LQRTAVQESGTLTVNVHSQDIPPPTFAGYGAFINNYTPCSGYLVPGTFSGPTFTNGAWELGNSGAYIFTNHVGQANSQIDYWIGSNCNKVHRQQLLWNQRQLPTRFDAGRTCRSPSAELLQPGLGRHRRPWLRRSHGSLLQWLFQWQPSYQRTTQRVYEGRKRQFIPGHWNFVGRISSLLGHHFRRIHDHRLRRWNLRPGQCIRCLDPRHRHLRKPHPDLHHHAGIDRHYGDHQPCREYHHDFVWSTNKTWTGIPDNLVSNPGSTTPSHMLYVNGPSLDSRGQAREFPRFKATP